MLRLDGYVRVSRVGGRAGEGYISPAVQRDAIEAYARELSGEIVAWHADEDYSGGNTDRPGFQAVLDRLRAGATDGVVVMRVDRFARSVADGSRIVREIVDAGQVFASCHERIDPRTPEGRYMLTSFLANAELFLDQVKQSWWAAKSRAIARGAHIGPTPFGYDRIPRGQPGSGRLVPGRHAPVVAELFRRDSTRAYTLGAHARWLDEHAPRERRGRPVPWTETDVARILASRVYLGEVRYGQLVNPNAHDPLVSHDLWARCQRRRGERRSAHRGFLLSGIVRCANCRYAMAGWAYGGSDGATRVYVCRSKSCDQRSTILARTLEEHVLRLVEPALRRALVATDDHAERLAALDARIAELREERAAFAADLEARRLLGNDWLPALEARTRALEQAIADRAAAVEHMRLAELGRRSGTELDHDDLRDFLLGAVRHVFVRRVPGRRRAPVADRALVIWADDPREIAIPSRSTPGSPGPFWDD